MSKTNKVCDFNKLALGTRFRYLEGDKTYVKLGHDTIAEWSDEQIDTTWIGQGIYSARNQPEDYLEVEIVG